MLERIFGKKKEPATAPDVTMAFEIPEDVKQRMNGWAGKEAKGVFADYLKTLNRVQLLCVEDNPWFKEHGLYDWLWEAYDEEEYERQWPMSKYHRETMIPDLILETIPIEGLDMKKPIDLSKLARQVEGIQKRLDRVLKIIENTEVTMSAKTALTM